MSDISECETCKGSGLCQMCGGTGSDDGECCWCCFSTEICQECDGTGETDHNED